MVRQDQEKFKDDCAPDEEKQTELDKDSIGNDIQFFN